MRLKRAILTVRFVLFPSLLSSGELIERNAFDKLGGAASPRTASRILCVQDKIACFSSLLVLLDLKEREKVAECFRAFELTGNLLKSFWMKI